MNYNELIQLYFERSTRDAAYWNLYVVIVGGLLWHFRHCVNNLLRLRRLMCQFCSPCLPMKISTR